MHLVGSEKGVSAHTSKWYNVYVELANKKITKLKRILPRIGNTFAKLECTQVLFVKVLMSKYFIILVLLISSWVLKVFK